jgi:hypothetical protein
MVGSHWMVAFAAASISCGPTFSHLLLLFLEI